MFPLASLSLFKRPLILLYLLRAMSHPCVNEQESLKPWWDLQSRVCEQLPIPECKRRRDGRAELCFYSVHHFSFLDVHQTEPSSLVVQQESNPIGFPHKRHRDLLASGHSKPLPLDKREHPCTGIGAHAFITWCQHLSHAHPEFMGLFNRHLPVVPSRVNVGVSKNNRPVPESERGVLHERGVHTKHSIDHTGVLLKKVQAAVGCPLVKLKLQICYK